MISNEKVEKETKGMAKVICQRQMIASPLVTGSLKTTRIWKGKNYKCT